MGNVSGESEMILRMYPTFSERSRRFDPVEVATVADGRAIAEATKGATLYRIEGRSGRLKAFGHRRESGWLRGPAVYT